MAVGSASAPTAARIAARGGRVARPVRARLREQPLHHRVEPRVLLRMPCVREVGGRGGEVGVDEGRSRVLEEREPAAEHLVEHHPERVEISPTIERSSLDLLGRHVRERPHEHARIGLDGGSVDALRDAEVDDLGRRVGARRALGEEDIARLDVAVDHPERVGRREPAADLGSDVGRSARRERLVAPQPLLERLAGEQLHAQEGVGPVLAGLVDRDDVRVAYLRGLARLREEAVLPVRIEEQLERDLAAFGEIARAVDDRHAAAAELALELIAAGEHAAMARPVTTRARFELGVAHVEVRDRRPVVP